MSERVTAWGLAGYGTGELTLTEEGGAPIETDIRMTMGAVGGRGTLVAAPASGGFGLAIKSDAFWVRTESDKTEGMEAAEADVTRLRLLVDASRPFDVEGGGTLTPSVELGVRLDGGDAETGTGVEVGASLRYAGQGVTVEGSVRGLVAHEESGYEEWGASGSVRLDPGASGRGLSLTLAPSYGNASSGTQRLWSLSDTGGLAPDREFEAGHRLDTEVGYGLDVPRGLGVVTPYAGIGLAEDGGRSWRAGRAVEGGARGELESRRDTAQAAKWRRARARPHAAGIASLVTCKKAKTLLDGAALSACRCITSGPVRPHRVMPPPAPPTGCPSRCGRHRAGR